MKIKTARRNDDRSEFDPAAFAAEISRLETFLDVNAASERLLLGAGQRDLFLKKEMAQGPLADLLRESDDDPNLALLRAKAQLAAYNARIEIEGKRNPPWLRTLTMVLVIPLFLGIIAPSIVNLVTTNQQLKLFREQNSVEATREQADLLLGKLSTLVVRARDLRDSIEYFEVEGLLEQTQADRLHRKAVELEQDFRSAVQIHSFDSSPQLRDAELLAFYEIRALEDCLYKAAGRRPSEDWRRGIVNENELSRAITSKPPCGDNFDTGIFESLTVAVNSDIASRIGGALFPRDSE